MCLFVELRSTAHVRSNSLNEHGVSHVQKFLACPLILAAAIGMSACDSKSEDKAQQAQHHAEQAQDKMNDAATENEKAAKAEAESKDAKAQENKTFVPTSAVPESIQTPPKN
jgi:hypothetical protein